MAFCRNCANPMDPKAVVCVRCGTKAGMGYAYCSNCGQPANPYSTLCPTCGVAQTPPIPQGQQKSKIAAGLLGLLLGAFGVHNFYLGYIGKGVAQLLITLLSCFILTGVSEIWGIIEGIMILTGSIATDGKGVPLGD